MALTQSQMIAAVAERAEMSKAEAKRALDALDEIVLEELGNAQKVRLGGLVQLTVRVKPATKKRPGRNPATGEEITIAAKPASVDVRARPLAKAKAALPSVQKARRRLAASNGRASREGQRPRPAAGDSPRVRMSFRASVKRSG
ncbi:MAG: HU family DNA-binding protein [Solirubrobacterales bacterium]|nr:HU family DNA-binding protein [Solirubrobacterales bacterium]MBV9944052.1 HU family DNA-binding protein [Solirubrobacterales bacterium]